MAYLGTNDLIDLLPTHITPFRKERIKQAAYELSLGNQIFRTSVKTGVKEVLDEKNTQIVIEPGQFALLLTEEIVEVPVSKIAFISIKFKLKKKGLINVSGFHVDPGFKGKIKFSVYNAGPSQIHLDKGHPYFLIWYCELTGSAEKYQGSHNGQNDIDAEDIDPLKGEIASPNVLLERIRNNEALLRNFIWAAGIIIGIGIALTLKSWSDNSKFDEGYFAGLRQTQLKQQIDTLFKQVNVDSIVAAKLNIDSVIFVKVQQAVAELESESKVNEK